MTPALLREIGEALHGYFWVGPLAEQLLSPDTGRPISRRTVERWRDDEFVIPATIAPELAHALEARIAVLQALRRRLRS